MRVLARHRPRRAIGCVEFGAQVAERVGFALSLHREAGADRREQVRPV